MKTLELTLPSGLTVTATLIREESPRLALCQDRVLSLTPDNQVVADVDLLALF